MECTGNMATSGFLLVICMSNRTALMLECKKKALGRKVRRMSYSYPMLGQRHNACGRVTVCASLTNELALQSDKMLDNVRHIRSRD